MRTALSVLLLTTAAIASIAACEHTVEEGCLSGPCGDVQPAATSSSTTGSGGGGGTAPMCQGDEFPATGDLPCDVWQVLHDRCHCCHQDPMKNGAPFPLLTYELTREEFNDRKLRWQRMAEVIEPDAILHMPLMTAAQLDETQLDTLRNWFAACAPPASEYGDGGPGCDENEPPPTACDPPQ